ncbi:hypothetical protein JB92DRAFT_2959841 [Gautieria morchelliformis]|nr:hypothetical protein JB92DRAFT_2959841 [Gautieria morchelliformis]
MTHTSAPVTPTKLGSSPVAGARSVYSPAKKRRKYETTIMFPTPALAAAALGKPITSASTVNVPMVEPISKTQEPVEFNDSHARLPVQSTSDGIAPPSRTTVIVAPTNVPGDVDSDSPSSHPPRTLDNKKQWCYCDCPEYGAMIMCGNPACTKQWFHVPCTGLEEVPEGDWSCNRCAPPDSNILAKPHSDTQIGGPGRS